MHSFKLRLTPLQQRLIDGCSYQIGSLVRRRYFEPIILKHQRTNLGICHSHLDLTPIRKRGHDQRFYRPLLMLRKRSSLANSCHDDPERIP